MPKYLTDSSEAVKSLGGERVTIPLVDGATVGHMDTVRDRVGWILTRTGWSQRELAKRAGLAPSHISLIMTRLGDDVRPSTVRAIAAAANVSETWLLAGTGDPEVVPHIEEASGPAPEEYDWRSVPAFERLPNWPQLLAAAQGLRPQHPAYVWQQLGQIRPLLTSRPTPGMVADLADVVLRHGEPPAGPAPRR